MTQRWLQVATTFGLGLLAGAMLLIGGAIVPYWFSLDPLAFSAWRSRSPARSYFATAAVLASVVALIYFVEHASLNAEIGSGSLSPAEVVLARESWRAWHWVRVGAGVLGFLAGLVGLGQTASAGANDGRQAPG